MCKLYVDIMYGSYMYIEIFQDCIDFKHFEKLQNIFT